MQGGDQCLPAVLGERPHGDRGNTGNALLQGDGDTLEGVRVLLAGHFV